MEEDFRTVVLKKKAAVDDEYIQILLKELAKRGVDTPVPEKDAYMDDDGNVLGSQSSSADMNLFIDANGNELEGFPLYLRSYGSVSDKRKNIKSAEVIITTTFEYRIGDEATYKMKDSDWEKLRKILKDV
jgi:hypothetical protein